MLFIFKSPHKSRLEDNHRLREQLAVTESNMPPDLRVANQLGRKDGFFISADQVSLVITLGKGGKGR